MILILFYINQSFLFSSLFKNFQKLVSISLFLIPESRVGIYGLVCYNKSKFEINIVFKCCSLKVNGDLLDEFDDDLTKIQSNSTQLNPKKKGIWVQVPEGNILLFWVSNPHNIYYKCTY